jgi:hypothetical protein
MNEEKKMKRIKYSRIPRKNESDEDSFALNLHIFSFRVVQYIGMFCVSQLFKHLHGGGVPIFYEACNDIDTKA